MIEADRLNLIVKNSSYVANCIKHIWLSQLLQLFWAQRPDTRVQIFHAEVDDCGCDIVLTAAGVTRHIQLKATHSKSKTSYQDIHLELQRAAGGCVVWMYYHPVTWVIQRYLFFGAAPGEQMPVLAGYPEARRTTPNMTGVYPLRPNIRTIKRAAFEAIPTLPALAERLFGLPFEEEKAPGTTSN